jgi:hypothetical protein
LNHPNAVKKLQNFNEEVGNKTTVTPEEKVQEKVQFDAMVYTQETYKWRNGLGRNKFWDGEDILPPFRVEFDPAPRVIDPGYSDRELKLYRESIELLQATHNTWKMYMQVFNDYWYEYAFYPIITHD